MEFLAIALAISAFLLSPLVAARAILEFLVWLFPGREWVKDLNLSVGPKVPFSGATRADVFGVFKSWLRASLIFFGIVGATSMTIWGLEGTLYYESIGLICYVVMSLGLFAGCLCLVESAWVLVRLLSCRSGHPSAPFMPHSELSELSGPPNNSMNPSAGGRHPSNSRVGLSPAAGYAGR